MVVCGLVKLGIDGRDIFRCFCFIKKIYRVEEWVCLVDFDLNLFVMVFYLIWMKNNWLGIREICVILVWL